MLSRTDCKREFVLNKFVIFPVDLPPERYIISRSSVLNKNASEWMGFANRLDDSINIEIMPIQSKDVYHKICFLNGTEVKVTNHAK